MALQAEGVLCGLGFALSDADPCFCILHTNDGVVLMVVYVDMFIVPTLVAVSRVKGKMLCRFDARDMGEAGIFLDMSIVLDRRRTL
jgi:hypothetical protein